MRGVLKALGKILRWLTAWVEEGHLQVPYVLGVFPLTVVLQIPNNKQCTHFNLVVISDYYSRSGIHAEETG